MKKRKIFTICSLFLVMLCSFLVASCGACTPEDSSSTIEPTITMPKKELLLDKEEMSILLGESDYILAETVGMDVNTPVTFQSLDENVATVDGIGVVQAKNIGSTTVTVTADGIEKTCTVHVTLGQYLPEISLKQIDGESATIGTDGALNFEPIVIFNHQEYTDATYSYNVVDETIGTVQNGVFTATGKIGSTAVTVYAEWRGQSGKTMATLQKVVTVTVAVPVIELYTKATFDGKAYDTYVSLAEVIGEENARDIQTNVLVGDDVIEIDSGRITALTYGKASITVTYKNAQAQTIEKRFDVIVQRPIAKYSEPINFSIMDGDIPVEALWGSAVEVTEAYFGTPTLKGEAVTVTDGKITEGISLTGKASERKTVTLLTETEGYTVELCVYTKLIDEAEDLSLFNLADKDITGVYLVTKDLDASGIPASMHTDFVNNGKKGFSHAFAGVFDGGGHTVTVNVTNGGLFGKLENATVTNTNFILNISGTTNGSGYNPTGLAYSASGTTVSNVYAQLNPADGLTVASNRTWTLSLIANMPALAGANAQDPVTTTNVVVVNNDDFAQLLANTEKHWVGGVLFFADGGRASVAIRDRYMQNVFVIAPEKLGNGYYVPMAGGTARQTFASNDEEGKADAEAKTEQGQYTYANVTRYASLKALCTTSHLQTLPAHIVKIIAEQSLEIEADGDLVQDGAELQKGEWTPITLQVGNTVLEDVRLQSSDEMVAVVDGSSVKVDTFGMTVITATGTAFGVELTVTFNVTAKVEAFAETLLFSGVDGVVDMQTVFGKETVLVHAYGVDGTVYTVEDGIITDLTNNANEALTKAVILETAEGQFKKVTFKVYTKLLDEAEDLAVFHLTDKDITGCYLVTQDIDASGISASVHPDFANAQTGGGANRGYGYKFTGTFDGNGHTVTANVTYGGLFGVLENATITNTHFVLYIGGNNSTANNTGNRPTGLAQTALNSTVSNVYAELKPGTGLLTNREWAISLITKAPKLVDGYLMLENVVVVNNDDFANLKVNTAWYTVGALFYEDAGRAYTNRDEYMKNVFVIAPKAFGSDHSGYVAMASGTALSTFASNDTDSKEAVDELLTNNAFYQFQNVTRYATVKAFVDGKAWENVLPDFIMDAVNADNMTA